MLVPGCLGCGKAVRPSSRRAAPNRRPLAARRFFGFGVHGKHAFTAEAIADDTVIGRYPVSRMETLAAADAPAAGELAGIISRGMSRLHSLLLILGYTTAEQKVGSFLPHIQERVGNGIMDRI